MRDKTAEELHKQMDTQSATLARLSKDLQRELRVIQVLIAARAISSDAVDKARELVDAMG